jgi:hypothetical protein
VVGDPDQSIWSAGPCRACSAATAAAYGATRLDGCRRAPRRRSTVPSGCSSRPTAADSRVLRTGPRAPAPPRGSPARRSVTRPFRRQRIKRLLVESPALAIATSRSCCATWLRHQRRGAPRTRAAVRVRGSGAVSRNEVVRALVVSPSRCGGGRSGRFEGALASASEGRREPGPAPAQCVREEGTAQAVVDRLMYALAARDPLRYPLPWGGDAPEAACLTSWSFSAMKSSRAFTPPWCRVACRSRSPPPSLLGPDRGRRHAPPS